MLKAESISTYYGDVEALRDVSFAVGKGLIVSIIGSNGAGKSTTLNTISGVVRSRSGKVEFLGKRIEQLPPHDIVEMGIVQIPEGRLLFPYMTVQENLLLGSFAPRARSTKAENLTNIFDLFPVLKERQKQMAGTLSGGEQQMMAIARGLMANPKLLMLDEPSLGLAPIVVEQVFEIIKKIKSSGITILLVEQNVFMTLEIADWAYVLENGAIMLDGPGKALLDNPQVKQAYIGI